MSHLLLILLGGPVAIGGPLGLAIVLCERHANASAEAIRARHAEPTPAPGQRPAPNVRLKEIAR